MGKEFKELNDIAIVANHTLNIRDNSSNKIDYIKSTEHILEEELGNSIKLKKKLLQQIKNKDKNITNSINEISNRRKTIESLLNDEDKDEDNTYLIDSDWENILKNSIDYSKENDLDIKNAINSGFSNVEYTYLSKDIKEKYNLNDLEKDDIIFSSIAGTIAGLIDIFLVGEIKSGKNATGLQKIVDEKFENIVIKYAKHEKITQLNDNLSKANSEEAKEKIQEHINKIKNNGLSKKEAISILEKNHKVSYDATYNKQILKDTVEGLDSNNHHLFSLAHAPSLIGLIIGVVDQLTGKATFIDNTGSFKRVLTTNKNTELEGNIISKIIEAVKNWFGHIMSDISGSSNSKGRGSGLPAPFWSLLQKLQFGKIPINGEDKTIAQVSEWMFKNGYDIRAFTTQLIPVIIHETLVRLYWFFKQYFYHGKPFKDCIPISNEKNSDLSRMLLISSSVFSAINLVKASAKGYLSVSIPIFLMNLNYPGLLDLGYRSFENIINNIKRRKRVISILEENNISDY